MENLKRINNVKDEKLKNRNQKIKRNTRKQ